MATTYYVNKSGSNANNGTTPTLAKLTITAGVALMATGDSLVVGSGLYNEYVNLTLAGSTLIFYADGNVVIDGQGLTNPALIYLGDTGAAVVSFLPYATGGTWTFQNSSGGAIYQAGVGNGQNYQMYFTNCSFLGASYGIYTQANYGNKQTIVLRNCIFSGNTTASIRTLGSSYSAQLVASSIHQCVFYNTPYAYFDNNSNYGIAGAFRGNVFHTCTTAIYLGIAPSATGSIDYNVYYNCTNLMNYLTVNKTTLAAVQALGFEVAGGLTTNPVFEDVANNIFYPTVQLDPLVQRGTYPFSLIRGSNYNPDSKWNIIAAGGYDNSGWYNPDGNVTMVSNMFQLTSGTSGVIWSPVYDLGSSQIIQQFNVEAIQIWPANMVDTTTSDVRPNYQTAEIRVSASAFNQNNGVIAWTELKNKIDFITQGSTYMTGRYVQIRLTLRNADVAG